MAFNSVAFLFAFLPVAMVAYFLPKRRSSRNAMLVFVSLVFYATGGLRALAPLAASIAVNYAAGLAIDRLRGGGRDFVAKAVLAAGIAADVGLLAYFKYSGFFVSVLSSVSGLEIAIPEAVMLTGVSFFTFLGVSYLVDVYRQKASAARNILDVALYLGEFPTIIAGPITRWEQFAPQVSDRTEETSLLAEGIRRFVIGLLKKVAIAGPLGVMATQIDGIAPASLTTAVAWLGALAFTFQIYFDFSGYSDMAIGLARMFGLKLPENFRYPYASQSISEFWRRWHITLGAWFREYVYIPLGGSRVGKLRLVLNLLVVWALTGLWHGAAYHFIAWGLYYGVIITAEKLFLGTLLERVWRPLRHVYVMVLVVLGWVLFSAPGLGAAIEYLKVMFGISGSGLVDSSIAFYLVQYRVELVLGAIFCLPVVPWLNGLLEARGRGGRLGAALAFARSVAVVVLFVVGVAYVLSTTFTPFVYAKF